MKSKLIPLLMALLLLLSTFSLTSCRGERGLEKFSAHSFEYFDTVTTITGYAESKEAFDEISALVLNELREYHRLYTIYHRFEGMENLCTVNELVDGAHRTVTVDRRIIDLLLYAEEIYNATAGRVNIAMGSLLSIWHEYRTEGKEDPSAAKLPPMDKLLAAAEHTDIHNMIIDEQACTVTLTDPQMTLDVGAVAKGYATERVARMLEEKGVTGYVLNVGGNVRTIGSKPNGEGWTVGVESPVEGEDYTSYLALSGESLVTSGSYQRYYLVDGVRYHHIIHPDTLMPAEGYLSISVLTRDSGRADALSTALFCMTPEEGMRFASKQGGVEVQWILSDGSIRRTDGWDHYTVAL